MLLSLMELSVFCKEAFDPEKVKVQDFDIAPYFVLMPYEIVSLAYRRVFGSADVVSNVSESFGGDRNRMRQFWPHWKEAIASFKGRVTRNPTMIETLGLGELA
jgi:hypothetical protein